MAFTIKSRTMKCVAVMLAASLSVSSWTKVATAQLSLQPVKIAVGGKNVLDISYYFLLLPGPLGYWEQEGYKVELSSGSRTTTCSEQS